MFRIYAVAVYAFGIVLAGVPRQQLKIVVPEPQPQATQSIGSVIVSGHGYETSEYGGEFDGHVSSDDGKQSNGAELTSLAYSSALQAKNAVRSQLTAGSQAAFGVKSSLAGAALGAAQTAQAALVGKQAIVQNLKRQAIEAQQQVQGEISQYQQLETVAQAAQAASQQAQSQLNTLNAVLAAAQGGAQGAEQAAVESANAAAAQQSMVAEAKQRVANILGQLQNALSDLQETEASAYRAAESAQLAQSNAAAAGLAVAAASAKDGHSGGSGQYQY